MKSKWLRVLILALLCLMAFCLIAITTNVFSLDDLPINFVAAFLEAVVTAVITVVLLSGQSAAEEVKERNVSVFNKKSEIFQKYIDIVWQIWEDRNVSKEEYLELTTEYYKTLMIYLKKQSLQKIGQCLSNIGDFLDGEAENDPIILRDSIFAIINTLSTELSLGGQIDIKIYEELENKIQKCKQMGPPASMRAANVNGSNGV